VARRWRAAATNSGLRALLTSDISKLGLEVMTQASATLTKELMEREVTIMTMITHLTLTTMFILEGFAAQGISTLLTMVNHGLVLGEALALPQFPVRAHAACYLRTHRFHRQSFRQCKADLRRARRRDELHGLAPRATSRAGAATLAVAEMKGWPRAAGKAEPRREPAARAETGQWEHRLAGMYVQPLVRGADDKAATPYAGSAAPRVRARLSSAVGKATFHSQSLPEFLMHRNLTVRYHG
jgi:hypothetical protein